MIHLFDYTDRKVSGRLFADWLKLLQGAQVTNTLIRAEYFFYGNAYIIRKQDEQVTGSDMLGASDPLEHLVSMARKRNWVVDIFMTDTRNMHHRIERQIDDVITPTSDPETFLARKV
jgi:hypothetical protein